MSVVFVPLKLDIFYTNASATSWVLAYQKVVGWLSPSVCGLIVLVSVVFCCNVVLALNSEDYRMTVVQ